MLGLGAFFAFLAALTFGLSDATARRGVLQGSPFDALIISMPIGTVLFFIASLVTGQLFRWQELTLRSLLLLFAAGLVHFIWGRFWNFKALQALGTNLTAPISQLGILITLSLALIILGESLNPVKWLGIGLVIVGPLMVLREALSYNTQSLDFQPKFIQGYLAGVLSALGFGTSPILIRLALTDVPLAIFGGLVSYLSALLVLGLVLLLQGRLILSFRQLKPQTILWFAYAGTGIALSQLFRFVALGLAPVTIVSPLIRLSLIFRIGFSTLLNRSYEVLSILLIVGVAISFIGGLILVFVGGA